jgi:hypothetical protein
VPIEDDVRDLNMLHVIFDADTEMSVDKTTLAMLRYTKTPPCSRSRRVVSGTRESEQPVQTIDPTEDLLVSLTQAQNIEV